MKRTLLKLGNIATYTMMGATGVYYVAAMLYGVLPADVTQPIITTLNANTSAIIPVGISSGIATLGIVALKIGSKTLNEKLHQSNLSLQLWETNVASKIDTRFKLQEVLNDVVVAKQNEQIAKQDIIIKQQNALIGFNLANAQRNLMASDELVPKTIKDIYRDAISGLKEINYDVQPITKVVEQTIIKEVEIAVEKPKASW